MKTYKDYISELKNRVQQETGYKLSESTLKKIVSFYLKNILFELKDMKQINLKWLKMIPTKNSLKKYYRLYPRQDVLKISLLFKRDDVKKKLNLLRSIRKEYGWDKD